MNKSRKWDIKLVASELDCNVNISTILVGDPCVVERDWEEWDAQIERDSKAGKLDFLINEARQDKESGNTRPL